MMAGAFECFSPPKVLGSSTPHPCETRKRRDQRGNERIAGDTHARRGKEGRRAPGHFAQRGVRNDPEGGRRGISTSFGGVRLVRAGRGIVDGVLAGGGLSAARGVDAINFEVWLLRGISDCDSRAAAAFYRNNPYGHLAAAFKT